MAQSVRRVLRRHGAAFLLALDQRWVHFMLIALLMPCLACALAPILRSVVQFDLAVQDQLLTAGGPRQPSEVAERLPETRDILVIRLHHAVPRTILARVVDRLASARIVLLDFMFIDREHALKDVEKPWYREELMRWRAEDAELAQSISRAGNVVVGAWRRSTGASTGGPGVDPGEWALPPRALWEATRLHAHLGVDSTLTDPKVRRVRPFEKVAGRILPCAGLAVASSLGGARASKPLLERAVGLLADRRRVPVDEAQAMLIDFVGDMAAFSQDDNSYSYDWLLDGTLDASDLDGKIVVAGEQSPESKDLMLTPREYMPGLMVHCNVIATLRSAHGPPREHGPIAAVAVSLAAAALLAALMLRWPLWAGLVVAAAELVGIVLCGMWLLRGANVILSAGAPALSIALTYNVVALYEYRRARNMIGLFAGRQMVPKALPLFSRLTLGGREETATAFFCDVRGYGELTQHLAPREIGRLINDYTDALEQVVERHRGCTITYQGDGTFVLFEPAIAGPDFAARAVRAALELQQVFVELRAKWSSEQAPELEIGVGIATGKMLVGLVGARRRMQFSALGDAVNVAARIQGLSRQCGYGVLVTRETRDLVANEFETAACGQHEVKSHEGSVEVFGVVGPAHAANPTEGRP